MPDIHVVIPTTGGREKHLDQLLACLLLTQPPSVSASNIHVLVEPSSAWQPQGCGVDVMHNATQRGPGARWYFISELAKQRPNAIVVALDDDVRVRSGFVSQSLDWLELTGAVVSWWPLSEAEVQAHAPAVSIPILAGGLTVLRARWLEGIENAPGAERGLGLDFIDDVYLSWFLWRRGLPIVRPAHTGERLFELAPVAPTRDHVHGKLKEQLAWLETLGALRWDHQRPARRYPIRTEGA